MGLTALLGFGLFRGGTHKAADSYERVRLEWKLGDEDPQDQEAVVELREDWGLTVLVSKDIEKRTIVRVREGGSSHCVEVIESAQVHDGFELELAFLDNGRRREPRIAAMGAAWLEAGEAVGARAIRATVVNVSAGGMGLLCDRFWATGETLRVRGEGTERLGRVRYCIRVADCYQVGLQFCEVDRNEQTD